MGMKFVDGEKRKVEVIINRYCDVAMARKRGLLPCEKKCTQCFACIEVLSGGERRHFSPKR